MWAAQTLRTSRRIRRGLATDAFSALEHKMWQAGAESYSQTFAKVTGMATNSLLDKSGVPLTSPMAVSIVERTPLESREGGLRVLDVATGPGMIADAAAARGHAEVVALDFSSAMLKEAQAVVDRHPDGVVKLVEGDAAALPFDDASFDAVVIGFGLLHLPKPQLALKEACRVLKKGGRLAYSVWVPPPENAAFRILNDTLAAHGSKDAKLPGVQGREVARVLSAAAAMAPLRACGGRRAGPGHAAPGRENRVGASFSLCSLASAAYHPAGGGRRGAPALLPLFRREAPLV